MDLLSRNSYGLGGFTLCIGIVYERCRQNHLDRFLPEIGQHMDAHVAGQLYVWCGGHPDAVE